MGAFRQASGRVPPVRARRNGRRGAALCRGQHIAVTEVWSYHSVGDDVRFTLIHRSKEAPGAGASCTPRAARLRRKPQVKRKPVATAAAEAACRQTGRAEAGGSEGQAAGGTCGREGGCATSEGGSSDEEGRPAPET